VKRKVYFLILLKGLESRFVGFKSGFELGQILTIRKYLVCL